MGGRGCRPGREALKALLSRAAIASRPSISRAPQAPALFMPAHFSRRRIAVILSVVLTGAATTGWSSAAPTPAAVREIDALISHVSGLEHVRVLGGPLTVAGPTAARFLRHELAEKSALIDSAEDFIRLCATRSEQTGRTYEVAYPGGMVLPVATVLRQALSAQRARAPAALASALSGG